MLLIKYINYSKCTSLQKYLISILHVYKDHDAFNSLKNYYLKINKVLHSYNHVYFYLYKTKNYNTTTKY